MTDLSQMEDFSSRSASSSLIASARMQMVHSHSKSALPFSPSPLLFSNMVNGCARAVQMGGEVSLSV